MTMIGISVYSFIQLGLFFLLGLIWLYCVIFILNEISQFFSYRFNSFNWIGLIVVFIVFYLSTKKIKDTCLPAMKLVANYNKETSEKTNK